MKQGFFEGVKGEKSSTRLIGFIVIVGSLLQSMYLIWKGSDPISAATLFTMQSGTAMASMFFNKKEELKKNAE